MHATSSERKLEDLIRKGSRFKCLGRWHKEKDKVAERGVVCDECNDHLKKLLAGVKGEREKEGQQMI